MHMGGAYLLVLSIYLTQRFILKFVKGQHQQVYKKFVFGYKQSLGISRSCQDEHLVQLSLVNVARTGAVI